MRYRLLFTAGITLAAGYCGLNLRAQDSAAAPVIRTESRVVLVDAVAQDKKGKFVRDLAQKDFKVFEDGKEQTVTSFSLESSGMLADRPGKHYLVLFFDSTTGGQLVVRQQALKFVDAFASPDRYMAVLSYRSGVELEILRNFTTDGALVKKAINSVQPTNLAAGATHDYLESLRNVAKSLALIRGRKALVMFGGGASLAIDNQEDFDNTVLALNKANVAVYSVGSGQSTTSAGATGMDASSGGAPRPSARGRGVVTTTGATTVASSLSFASLLADSTGGNTALTTNDIASDLGKIAQEQDQYYLLGYTPSVESAEGKCHNLVVKVGRGDLEIRSRKSYCTERSPDVLSGKPLGADLEAKAANAGTATNLPAKMELPWFYAAPNVARVNLAMDLNPSSLKFAKDKGRFHSELNLAGVAYKQDGSIAARLSDTVSLDFNTQQQVDAFLSAPYHYENQFDLAPGQYKFRMAFGSGAGDAEFGKAEMPLAIDPWDGQTLGASAIALSHDAHPAADLTAGLNASLLEGKQSLIAKGTEVVPTGDSSFHTGEQGAFYLEAYEPLLSAAKADGPLPLIGLRVRVLDRASGQQKSDTGVKSINSFMRPGNPDTPIMSSLPTANLPAGNYRLEITVMRQTGMPLVRTADFDLK